MKSSSSTIVLLSLIVEQFGLEGSVDETESGFIAQSYHSVDANMKWFVTSLLL